SRARLFSSPRHHYSIAPFSPIIRQFHHVEETLLRAADMEDGHEVRMSARNRFIAANPVELALEGPGIIELVAADDLHRAQRAKLRVPRQPYLAVRPAANTAKQFVVGDAWKRSAFAIP